MAGSLVNKEMTGALRAEFGGFPAGMTKAEIREWARKRSSDSVARMLAAGDTFQVDRSTGVFR